MAVYSTGEGIGKNADGILQPIRPSLKFDKAGLSFDKAREFTDHWWERAFNSAASNLNVDNSIGNVSLSVKDIDSTEVCIYCDAKYLLKCLFIL